MAVLHGGGVRRGAQWYVDRAKLACTVNQKLPDGAVQCQPPEADGRIRTARNADRANNDAPDYSEAETYPEQYFNAPLEDRDRLQMLPWPTPAWQANYGRRELVETGNSQDKDEGGFSEGTCRVASFVAHIVTATLVQVINNLEETRRYELKQQKLRDEATKQHPDANLNGTTPDPVTLASTREAETAEATTVDQPNGQTPGTYSTVLCLSSTRRWCRKLN